MTPDPALLVPASVDAGTLLGLALQAGDLGTFSWEVETGDVVWDHRALEIFGYADADEIDYGAYDRRIHPDDRDRVSDELAASVERGGSYRLEHRVLLPDGSVRWIRGMGTVLAAGDDRRVVYGCVADISSWILAQAQHAGVLEMLTFLVGASELLSQSLDLEETLEQVVELAVPRLADTVGVGLLVDGQLEMLVSRHADPSRAGALAELYADYPVQMDQPGMGLAVTTRQIQVIPEVPDSLLRAVAVDARHHELLTELQIGSALAVPLLVGDAVVGAIGLGLDRGRPLGQDVIQIATALSSRAAVAIENARLHRTVSTVADALQAGLAPAALPHVPGIRMATRYVAAGEGVVVGGDFYDLVELPDGDRMLVVGDVCGRGPAAASMNAQLRFAARALARAGQDVAEVAAGLNHNVGLDAVEGGFCTAVVACLHHVDDALEMDLVAAGHPSPWVRHPDGTVSSHETGNPLLGVVPDATFVPEHLRVGQGEVVLVVTDGVLEARGPDGELFGEDRLVAAMQAAAPTADGVVTAVEQAVRAFVGDRVHRDDMAMVALQPVPVEEGLAT